jgi:hypothetical protein
MFGILRDCHRGIARLRAAADPSSAQMSGELGAQHRRGLHEQRGVDRLVRHPHRRIVRELGDQPAADLLR